MNVRELKEQFSKRQSLITVSPETPVEEAIARMRESEVHHLIVMKEGCFLGIVSSRDLVIHGQGSDWIGATRRIPVSEAMRVNVPSITEETDVRTALSLMLRNATTGLPLKRNGEVVDVVTETDMLRVLETTLEKSHRLADVAAEGEAVLAHPLTQNFIKALSDAGI
jgi:CBS domain-containing protein